MQFQKLVPWFVIFMIIEVSVSIFLLQLQHESATVSYAVHHWINIKDNCGLEGVAGCKFFERMESALTPVVCAAYLLDPYYRGN